MLRFYIALIAVILVLLGFYYSVSGLFTGNWDSVYRGLIIWTLGYVVCGANNLSYLSFDEKEAE